MAGASEAERNQPATGGGDLKLIDPRIGFDHGGGSNFDTGGHLKLEGGAGDLPASSGVEVGSRGRAQWAGVGERAEIGKAEAGKLGAARICFPEAGEGSRMTPLLGRMGHLSVILARMNRPEAFHARV